MGIKYSIRISIKYNLKYTSPSTNNSKMKFSFTLLALAAAQDVAQDDTWYGAGASNSTATAKQGQRSGQAVASTEGDDAERRYDDLESIAKKYWNKQGMTGKNKFDDRKYWTYGCHCFLLGDRPMSEMGKGRPVDALDNKCKAYKDCQKCVRAKHGDQCIGEFVRYTWKYASKFGDFVSNNAAFNADYHAFWSTTGFDNREDENCPSGGTVPVEHQCCGGVDAPWYWIGLNNNKCCGQSPTTSGVVVGANDQC